MRKFLSYLFLATGGFLCNANAQDTTYPFELSDKPENGIFSETNTHWYKLKLNNKYAVYNNATDYVPLQSQDSNTPSALWAFVATDNGIQIYNAEVGANAVLATPQDISIVAGESTTNPTMISLDNFNATTHTNEWTYSSSTGNNFTLNPVNISGKYLNDFANQNKIGFWTAQDGAGSQLVVESINNTNVVAELRNKLNKTFVGGNGIAAEKVSDYESALAENSENGITKAINIFHNNSYVIQFDANKYYRIKNYARKYSTKNTEHPNDGGYLEAVDFVESPVFIPTNITIDDAIKFYANDCHENRANAIWKFEPTGQDGSYYLYTPNQKVYIPTTTSTGQIKTTATNKEGAMAFTLKSWDNGQFSIVASDESGHLHASGASAADGASLMKNAGTGAAGGASAWILYLVKTIDLTISDAKYATVNYPFAVQLPEGLTAYTGTIDADNQSLVLTEIEGGFIPAETPVVIAGEPATYNLEVIFEDTTEPLETDLKGTLAARTITESDYILAQGGADNSAVGFYKVADLEAAPIAQNKGYLNLEDANPAANLTKGFTFSFGDNNDGTTGIESIEGAQVAEEYYDLQGRRVMNPTKGIYVTKSGKKVLFM